MNERLDLKSALSLLNIAITKARGLDGADLAPVEMSPRERQQILSRLQRELLFLEHAVDAARLQVNCAYQSTRGFPPLLDVTENYS